MIRKLALLFLLAGCFSQSPNPPGSFEQIKVSEAIDGDTIRLEGGNILRYIGLDTPEIRIKKGKTFLYSPQPFSLEAREFNRQLVEGKFVKIEFDIERMDKYGRLLGYVFLDDKFINAKMIEEGFAVTYTKPPNIKYADLFLNLQRKARQDMRGLWGAYDIIDQGEAGLYINQIRTVKGKVIKTYKSKKCVFLNFGSNYKIDFTVVIFNDSLKFFTGNGIDPQTYYTNKTIEVTGKILQYNGPEIIVHGPDEITVKN